MRRVYAGLFAVFAAAHALSGWDFPAGETQGHASCGGGLATTVGQRGVHDAHAAFDVACPRPAGIWTTALVDLRPEPFVGFLDCKSAPVGVLAFAATVLASPCRQTSGLRAEGAPASDALSHQCLGCVESVVLFEVAVRAQQVKPLRMRTDFRERRTAIPSRPHLLFAVVDVMELQRSRASVVSAPGTRTAVSGQEFFAKSVTQHDFFTRQGGNSISSTPTNYSKWSAYNG